MLMIRDSLRLKNTLLLCSPQIDRRDYPINIISCIVRKLDYWYFMSRIKSEEYAPQGNSRMAQSVHRDLFTQAHRSEPDRVTPLTLNISQELKGGQQ